MWMRPFFSSLVAYFLMCRLKPPFREPPSSAYFRAVSIFISPLIFAVVNFSRLLDILDARNSKAYKKELFCFFRKGLNEILLNFLIFFYINIVFFSFLKPQSVILLSVFQGIYQLYMISSIGQFSTIFDVFDIKLTQMDQVSSSMIENLRPTRSLYQKILMEKNPGIFSESIRKARFSTRIENCLNQDNDGYVSWTRFKNKAYHIK